MMYTTDPRAGQGVLSDPYAGRDHKLKGAGSDSTDCWVSSQGLQHTCRQWNVSHVVTLWAYWCCPVRRLSWGCRSPSLSPLGSPRSPAETSCLTEWCRWSSPHTLETSACRHSVSPRCSLPWGQKSTAALLSAAAVRSEVRGKSEGSRTFPALTLSNHFHVNSTHTFIKPWLFTLWDLCSLPVVWVYRASWGASVLGSK